MDRHNSTDVQVIMCHVPELDLPVSVALSDRGCDVETSRTVEEPERQISYCIFFIRMSQVIAEKIDDDREDR